MARIQQVVTNFSGAGTGPWLKHDFYETPFCLSFMLSFDPTPGATCGIDYVVDDFLNDGERGVMFAQTGTTITISDDRGINQPGWAGGGQTHGLAVGDWVQLRGTPQGLVDGGYAVASVTSPTAYTLTATYSQTVALRSAFIISARIVQATAADQIVPLDPVSVRTCVGVRFPIVASRLRCSGGSGFATLLSVQGGNLGSRI